MCIRDRAYYLLIKNLILDSTHRTIRYLLFLKHNLNIITDGRYMTPYGILHVNKIDYDLKTFLLKHLFDIKDLLDHIIAKVKSL